jgi:putative flippase GtrA
MISSLMTYGIFLTLCRYGALHYLTASGIGYSMGVVTSFLMHKEWTFRVRGGEAACLRFALIQGISMGINVGALQFLSASFGLAPEVGQLVALGCAGPVNFFGNKFWTFGSVRIG